jgi:hypothetical protein
MSLRASNCFCAKPAEFLILDVSNYRCAKPAESLIDFLSNTRRQKNVETAAPGDDHSSSIQNQSTKIHPTGSEDFLNGIHRAPGVNTQAPTNLK